MEEISKKPLVDILSQMSGSQVVMKESDYVLLQNGITVSQSEVDEALVIQESLYQEEVEGKQAQEIKQAKDNALATLTVTTANGNTFDADNVARQDMLSAIEASNTFGLTEKEWKLADNTWKIISLAELKEASALAIQAKGVVLAS